MIEIVRLPTSFSPARVLIKPLETEGERENMKRKIDALPETSAAEEKQQLQSVHPFFLAKPKSAFKWKTVDDSLLVGRPANFSKTSAKRLVFLVLRF